MRDLAFELAPNGVVVAHYGGKIAAYLTNPSVFGTPYLPPTPVGAPVRPTA